MKSGSAANDDHDDRDSSPSWPLRPSPRRGPSSFQSRPVGVIMQFGAGAGAVTLPAVCPALTQWDSLPSCLALPEHEGNTNLTSVTHV